MVGFPLDAHAGFLHDLRIDQGHVFDLDSLLNVEGIEVDQPTYHAALVSTSRTRATPT